MKMFGLNRKPDRSDYKGTWQALAATPDAAKMAVGGSASEDQLDASGLHTLDVLNRFVGIKPSDVVLEIGCGVGRVGKHVSPRCSNWIGADISRRMLDVAAHRLKHLKNVELVELKEVALREIPSACIDLVYCTVVFMHLFEWDRYRYVQEAHRVLKRGGRCFFDALDISSEVGWKVFTDGCAIGVDVRPAHLSMVSTGEELMVYATQAGFQEVALHRWDDAWIGVTGTKWR